MSIKPLPAICDAGCEEQFEVTEFNIIKMDEGIEKTYFTCPHCEHEYLVFYTDAEIRKLQNSIPIVGRMNGKSSRVLTLYEQVKEKMDALRVRMEATHAAGV